MLPDLDLLNRKFFALIRESGLTADRHVFQRGLYDRGLVSSASVRDWLASDYRAGIQAVQEVIDNAA